MVDTQLSLFDTSIDVGTSYKAGDWVKLRRKPAITCGVKQKEVFQINAVHPTNGSMRFWNPHINQWDFLYPEEVKLTVEPVVGELVKTKPIAEPVVGELVKTKPIAEPVVGERKNYWNSDKGYSGNGWLESHYKIRVNGKQHSINCPEIGCTGPYNSYRWMDGKHQRAKYCPANVCPAVRKALKNGEPISEILKIISNQ